MKKSKKNLHNDVPAAIRAEMALPRMSRSARIAGLSADKARVVERPSTIVPGTVDKLIPSPTPCLRDKAQISIEGEVGYRKLRIENSLTDEHGDEVRLEKGARVEVTVSEDKDLNKKSSARRRTTTTLV